ncbi:MAG: aryl-alcohol dehydrogenase-like predicted oxidoreductase [Candidatus Promineifilaceae bacterium]|jgi:aryl-alcohol dehydrogenase-like predicted oxidoreductase
MNYNYLGNTGVKVSELCFGTMTFGDPADEQASAAMYAACRDAGINFFDCANVYVDGRSEEILGDLMQGHRDEIVLSTKFFGQMGSDINAKGGSRRNIVQSLEASLKRLKTDYIDLYFMHGFDPGVPLEETLRALDDMVKQGKILYIGASNYAAWQVAKGLGLSAANGWARFECIQPMYNLIKKQTESELLPMALSENVAVIPYNPLAGGILTGKYGLKKNEQIAGRLNYSDMYHRRYGNEDMLETAARFVEFATEHGYDPVSLAIAWVNGHPAVTAPILGARNAEQLKSAIKSVDIDMTADLRQAISDLTPPSPSPIGRDS